MGNIRKMNKKLIYKSQYKFISLYIRKNNNIFVPVYRDKKMKEYYQELIIDFFERDLTDVKFRNLVLPKNRAE